MNRKMRFIVGAVIIVAALAYLIYGGMREAMVYFVTPTELKAQTNGGGDRFFRVGGMVLTGSLHKDLQNRTFRFQLSDGVESIPIHYQGVPPDLFREGTGAVVEGRLGPDHVFRATTIMAKHAEEYSPSQEGHEKARSFVPGKE